MPQSIEARLEQHANRLRLCAPAVGWFSTQRTPGEVLMPGSDFGLLLILGREYRLLVPKEAQGRIASELPERTRQAVSYGECLLELEALSTEQASVKTATASAAQVNALVLLAPQTGRFYHRPAPKEPDFVQAGASLQEGQPIGLIEVMKTFTHVGYRAKGNLPARAEFVRYLVPDGADVKLGQPLIEVR
jgi:acetyl-CoA carboxylase biotin carboxyl carrier protein